MECIVDRVRRDLSGTNALLQQEQGRLRTAKEKISKLEDISRDQLHAIVHEIMQVSTYIHTSSVMRTFDI
jgi:hypothetical protein